MDSTLYWSIFAYLLFNIICCVCVPIPNDIGSESITKCKRKEYFHSQTQQCFKERTKGPCNGNMVFLKLDKMFGDCECPPEGILPWIYNSETNDCYQSFKQSYCSSGEWLIFDNEKGPKCIPNLCKDNEKIGSESDVDHPIVLIGDKCALLNKPSELCKANEEVKIPLFDVFPRCISSELGEYSLVKTSELKCKPGSRRDQNGNCRKTVTITGTTDY